MIKEYETAWADEPKLSDFLVRWTDAHRLKWSRVHVRRSQFSTCCGRWIPTGRTYENGSEVSGNALRCLRCFNFVYGQKEQR